MMSQWFCTLIEALSFEILFTENKIIDMKCYYGYWFSGNELKLEVQTSR